MLAALQRARKTVCDKCGKPGASIGCNMHRCARRVVKGARSRVAAATAS